MKDDHKIQNISLELSAVIVSVKNFTAPQILTIDSQNSAPRLPAGRFDPEKHNTLEQGLRKWIAEQTPFNPSYVEQLYTFGNKGRTAINGEEVNRVISVGYLALTNFNNNDISTKNINWNNWYELFPWEDWRDGQPKIINQNIIPALNKWINAVDCKLEQQQRLKRAAICFGMENINWDFDRVLERYELLYEIRKIPEIYIDKNINLPSKEELIDGKYMAYDHRRIIATAIGRLRGKIKYRPVIFELMPDSFTLLQLQRTVEAISGYKLHKQNFRRLLESNKLVEETGKISTKTGGRPAALFRFRKDVLMERIAIGVKMSPSSN